MNFCRARLAQPAMPADPAPPRPSGFLLAALAAALLAPLGPARAVPAEGKTADEIEACVRANLPSRSSVQEVSFRVNGPGGATTDSNVKIHWQQDAKTELSRVHLRFEAPLDMRGSALLLLEKPGRNDMFMYLPELKRVRRVTGPALSGGMFGTDFTYSQFERLQGVARDIEVVRLADGEFEGSPVYVLGHTPADDPEFDYVESYVDPERCVPMRTEFFEANRKLRKVLKAEPAHVKQVGSHWIPHRLVMSDVVRGTSTEFRVDTIEVNAKIHRRMFTEGNLAQGN